jgi:GNAT superfamily N-acetyltransferase
MEVILLSLEHMEAYLEHCAAHNAESGRDGDPYFGPYGKDDPYDIDVMRTRTHQRWTTALDESDWRRAWGVLDDHRIIASGEVTGRDLAADRHRVQLGMGVLHGYRHRGLGRRILTQIIAWCQAQPSIAWIDLGIIGDNPAAMALYRSMGFQEICVVPDRWRMDGHTFADTSMTLPVG